MKKHLNWIKISIKTEDFIEADVQYPEKLHELHNDLPFLPKRIKIEKTEKLVANFHDKKEHVIQQKNFKTSIKS